MMSDAHEAAELMRIRQTAEDAADFDLDVRLLLKYVFKGLGGIEDSAYKIVQDIESLQPGSQARVGLWKALLSSLGSYGEADNRDDDRLELADILAKEERVQQQLDSKDE